MAFRFKPFAAPGPGGPATMPAPASPPQAPLPPPVPGPAESIRPYQSAFSSFTSPQVPVPPAAPARPPAQPPGDHPAGGPDPFADLSFEPFKAASGRLVGETFRDFMLWAVEQGISDITLQSGRMGIVEHEGKLEIATASPLTDAELLDITNTIYGANGVAQLKSGRDFDVSYEIKLDRVRRRRFRVNATSVASVGGDGMQITFRVLPAAPPRIDDLGIEPGILANYMQKQGLLLVTGPTGSGKTTLLAALTRRILEDPDSHCKTLTYEAPIEFDLSTHMAPNASVAQTEIPRHLPSFGAGVRNAMRRAPDLIMVGESRDSETMGAVAEASLTGHMVFSTVHSNGVAETIRRMVSVFPAEEREQRALDLLEALRLIVTQNLLPGANGKRYAVREFLVFDDEVRRRMLSRPWQEWPRMTRDYLARADGNSQSMVSAIEKAAENNAITAETAEKYTRVYRRAFGED